MRPDRLRPTFLEDGYHIFNRYRPPVHPAEGGDLARRFEVLTCGRKMTPAERTEIRAWMADPKNIGALHRALLATPAVPLEVFDPYGVPPMFAGRREMIGMGRSEFEDAYDAAIEALEGCKAAS